MAKYIQTSMIIPAASVDMVNSALEDLGYGPDNFSVPIIQGAGSVVTHYGCSWSISDDQMSSLQAILQGKNAKASKANKDVVVKAKVVATKDITILEDDFKKVLTDKNSRIHEAVKTPDAILDNTPIDVGTSIDPTNKPKGTKLTPQT